MKAFALRVILIFMVIGIVSAAYNTMPVSYSPSTALLVFD